VTQFLTNPQQGGFDPLAAQGLDTAMQGVLGGGLGTGTGTGTGTGKGTSSGTGSGLFGGGK
jgi:hypothetical protein